MASVRDDDSFQEFTAGGDEAASNSNDHDSSDIMRTNSTEDSLNDVAEELDPELEAIKARVKEMEEEAERLKAMQSEQDKQMNLSATSNASNSSLNLSVEEKYEADNRSIYVGNVDYSATAEELESHFHGCGSVNRVTILCDKFSGHPKGFAYIEFSDKDSVTTSLALDDSLFRGRQIKVNPKRTNRPGISTTNRAPRARYRGRGRASHHNSGFGPQFRRGYYRPRRSNWFTPY